MIPPVSGGAVNSALHVRISSEPLSQETLVAAVSDPHAGAIVTFLGVTREVPALEYEAYAEMAVAKIREIAAAPLFAMDYAQSRSSTGSGPCRCRSPRS